MAVELKTVAASVTLNDEIEGSIAQVSVMWLLHRRSDLVQGGYNSSSGKSSSLAPLFLIQSVLGIQCCEMKHASVSGLFILRDC